MQSEPNLKALFSPKLKEEEQFTHTLFFKKS